MIRSAILMGAFIFTLTGAAGAASSQVQPQRSHQEIDQIYQAVSTKLTTSMLECPARIWQNYNWKTMNVLMINKDFPSRVWRGETGTTELLLEADIPAGGRSGLYSFFNWKNQDAVSIFLASEGEDYAPDAQQLLQLIVHEGFHYRGQRDWTIKTGGRGTAYPILASPRIYRRLLTERLRTYFLSSGKDSKALGQAAYWFQKWSQEFPAETQATTDGYEGTALYVEMLAPAILEVGCGASEADLLASAQRVAASKPHLKLGPNELQLDSEGYGVGGLSSLILRFFSSNTNWYQLVQKGQTPAEILLKQVEPIPDTADAKIVDAYTASAAELNASLNKMFGEDLIRFVSPEAIRIAMPKTTVKASYSPRGFFLPKSLPETTVLPLYLGLAFEGNTWTALARSERNLFLTPTPCGPDVGFSVVVLASEAKSTADQLELTSPTLSGTVKGQWKQDDKGRRWFCGL